MRCFSDAQADMPSANASGAICVQRFDDSRNSAIHTTYRISLRSSSLREPRYPLLRVVIVLMALKVPVCFSQFALVCWKVTPTMGCPVVRGRRNGPACCQHEPSGRRPVRPGFKAPLGWQARHSLVRATPAGSAEGAHSICILRVQFLRVINEFAWFTLARCVSMILPQVHLRNGEDSAFPSPFREGPTIS